MRVNIIIGFGILGVISLIILIVICSVVVPEYHSAKSYEEGVCRLTGSRFEGWKHCSYCTSDSNDEFEQYFGSRGTFYVDEGYYDDAFIYDDYARQGQSLSDDDDDSSTTCYTTWYPCLVITATYTTHSDKSDQHEAVFFDYAFQDHDCSVTYHYCRRYPFDNAGVVKEFRRNILSTYSLNRTFDCFHQGDRVIAHKRYSFTGVLHAVIWPSIFLLISATIVVILCLSPHTCSCLWNSRRDRNYNITHVEGDVPDGKVKDLEDRGEEMVTMPMISSEVNEKIEDKTSIETDTKSSLA